MKTMTHVLIFSCILLLGTKPKYSGQFISKFLCSDLEDVFRGISVYPGCALPDCCFAGWGCPQPASENFTIEISSNHEFVNGVGLGFNNLSDPVKKNLSRSNEIKIAPNNEIITKGNKLSIRGWDPLYYSDKFEGIYPIVSVDYEAIDESIIKIIKTAKTDSAIYNELQNRLPVVVEIVGRLGEVIVSRELIQLDLLNCWKPALTPTKDILDLQNKEGGEMSVALVDGRREHIPQFLATVASISNSATSNLLLPSKCVNDEGHQGTDQIHVGNFLSPGNCGNYINACANSEVAVFSRQNAMYINNTVVFSDTPDDVIEVGLEPLLNIPITVWIIYEPEDRWGSWWSWRPRWSGLAQVYFDIARANALFYKMGSGFRLVPKIKDLTNTSFPQHILDGSCANRSDVKSEVGYHDDRLNIYYVRAIDVASAFCGTPEMIFITSTASNETLAHEIGHALDLYHVNPSSGNFDSHNLMWGGSTRRKKITEGQSFRMNVNPYSWLNRMNIRSGLERHCSSSRNNCQCPRLDLDL